MSSRNFGGIPSRCAISEISTGPCPCSFARTIRALSAYFDFLDSIPDKAARVITHARVCQAVSTLNFPSNQTVHCSLADGQQKRDPGMGSLLPSILLVSFGFQFCVLVE